MKQLSASSGGSGINSSTNFNENMECFVENPSSASQSGVFGRNFIMANEKEDGNKFSLSIGGSCGKAKYTLLGSQQVGHDMTYHSAPLHIFAYNLFSQLTLDDSATSVAFPKVNTK